MPLSYGQAYGVGTISVVQGSLNVVGVGMAWLGVPIIAGDTFGAGGLQVTIATVVDNTHLTLAYVWPGATLVAQPYSIRADASVRYDPTAFAEEVRSFVYSLTQLTASGLAALIAYKGAYDAVETYEQANIVTNQGVAWVYINAASGFGNAPPTLPTVSNAYWQSIPNLTVQAVLDALGVHAIMISTSNPSGGVNGDLWFVVPV